MKIRINKYLASSGLGSRRKVEALVDAGVISVNGKPCDSLSTFIDTETDVVRSGNEIVSLVKNRYYIMLNKPSGFISTMSDEKGRPTVMDLIPQKYKRAGVFPVGRLDKDTEGLLLFTNDGDLALNLMKPSAKITKTYQAIIDRPLGDHEKEIFEKGFFIHQLKLKSLPARMSFLDKSRKKIRITLIEGKKREIRYALKNLGYRVISLKRTSIANITVEGLNKGQTRDLRPAEISKLKKILGAKKP